MGYFVEGGMKDINFNEKTERVSWLLAAGRPIQDAIDLAMRISSSYCEARLLLQTALSEHLQVIGGLYFSGKECSSCEDEHGHKCSCRLADFRDDGE